MIRKDGQPSVTGYLLTQDAEKYRGMELLETIGEDGFGAFKTYQVPLRTIQQLTGLNLERLMQFDPMAEVDPNERMNYNVIENEGQIRFYR
jgi:endonuclease G